MEIKINGVDEVKKMFAQMLGSGDASAEKALTVTINQTVRGVRQKLTDEIPKVFDQPVPRTKSSVRYETRSITKNKPSAAVFVNPWPDGGIPPVKYLWAQIQGGKRDMKRHEVALRNKGILPHGMRTRPGPGAPLNQYGNIPAGQYVKMLSQLKAFSEQGYRANATKLGNPRFFVKPGKGIFTRQAGSSEVKPFLFFINSPTYRKRFPFYEVGQEEADRLIPIEAGKALDYALRNY